MDRKAREKQMEFLQSVLGMLGPKDRFQLMACDVEVRAYKDVAVAVQEDEVAAALRFLEERPSLGWTDLEYQI
jgi:hypothetical protein